MDILTVDGRDVSFYKLKIYLKIQWRVPCECGAQKNVVNYIRYP